MKMIFFFARNPNLKKIILFFFFLVWGEGARTSDFFTKDLNQGKQFFFGKGTKVSDFFLQRIHFFGGEGGGEGECGAGHGG